jgi:hypothetical protein
MVFLYIAYKLTRVFLHELTIPFAKQKAEMYEV